METRPIGTDVTLCRARADDGVWLDGAFYGLDEEPFGNRPAALFVHGTGSHFYAGGILDHCARELRSSGMAVLRINTRGHDGMTTLATEDGPRPGGAAYESVDECPLDIHAWARWLTERGCSTILLVGHSMGAVKSAYTMAHRPLRMVCGLVCLSPPWFRHDNWLQDPRATSFRESLEEAQRLVDEDKGDRLILVRQPLPLVITAQGFLDKYGPHDRLDVVHLLKRVTCPTLTLVGGLAAERSPAFHGLASAVQSIDPSMETREVGTIDGATVTFANAESEVSAHLRDWVRRRLD